jgi:hypothetical protein
MDYRTIKLTPLGEGSAFVVLKASVHACGEVKVLQMSTFSLTKIRFVACLETCF